MPESVVYLTENAARLRRDLATNWKMIKSDHFAFAHLEGEVNWEPT
jgi:hypothetical protein